MSYSVEDASNDLQNMKTKMYVPGVGKSLKSILKLKINQNNKSFNYKQKRSSRS